MEIPGLHRQPNAPAEKGPFNAGMPKLVLVNTVSAEE